MRTSILACSVALACLGQLVPAKAKSVYENLYRFTGKTGFAPQGSLIEGANGVLYGTTSKAALGYGSVYSLTPPTGGGSWTLNVLYEFHGSPDGASPEGALVADSFGNLYGTTAKGGAAAAGTIFKLTPPAEGSTSWTETVLYSFQGTSDGGTPLAGLVLGGDGALYGTAEVGGLKAGTKGFGTVFKLTPPSKGQTAWTQTVLHTFQGPDGAYPHASLIADSSGALFGTTFGGGNQTQSCTGYDVHGCGTVFQLIPPAQGQTQWTENVLYALDATDGVFINSNLTLDKSGNLYGTAEYDSSGRYGVVFELSPGVDGNPTWTASTLYAFTEDNDGGPLFAGVIFGNDGALYGVTGDNDYNSGGTFFQLAPPSGGQGSWTETDLYHFKYLGNTAFNPTTPLLLLANGKMVGAAPSKRNGAGVVYQVTP